MNISYASNVITWDKAYSIGHEKIDKEHKRLFEIALEINRYADDSKMIMKLVKELLKYTKFHFKNEEDFMRSISYERIEEHKKLHIDMSNKLNAIVKNIAHLPLELMVPSLNDFVSNTILQHILLEDKKVHHAIKSRDDLKKLFQWKSDYKLNNEVLDDEHKKLFEIALRALDFHDTDIKEHIKLTIKELYNYMHNHFEHEEKYMQEIGYPEYEEHKIIHERIIEEMNKFIKKLPSLKIVDFERKLIEYMDIWLINHILSEDRKITKFLNS